MAQQISAVVDFATQADLTESQVVLLHQVYVFVEEFFKSPKFDASHDFAHVERVTKTALSILHQEKKSRPLTRSLFCLERFSTTSRTRNITISRMMSHRQSRRYWLAMASLRTKPVASKGLLMGSRIPRK